MKRNNIKSAKGFTLVEMLGVLAIIAILVSVVSVGVMSAIKSARITGTIANLKNYETAMAAHVTLNEGNGFIPLTKGGASVATGLANENHLHLGQVLLASGAFDNLPTWRIGQEKTNPDRVFNAVWNMTDNVFELPNGAADEDVLIDWSTRIRAESIPSTDQTAGFTLDPTFGVPTAFELPVQIPTGSTICSMVIPGVPVADAIKLSEALNRGSNAATVTNPVQTTGRFVFDYTGGTTGRVDCYYYLGYF